MVKAHFRTPQGIELNIEGSPREIAAVLEKLEKKSAEQEKTQSTRKMKRGRVLLGDQIASLRDGGFFKKPRDLASIKTALAEMGHHYPVTTLSPVMLRLVRRRDLRRIREKGRWLYTS